MVDVTLTAAGDADKEAAIGSDSACRQSVTTAVSFSVDAVTGTVDATLTPDSDVIACALATPYTPA
ncbi:MAG TPA: hypothetical protein VKR56_00060 [Candidatus Cybelea sp.]|nr:hypothetical protein [Candidatus Cybelea sp.]